MIWRYNLKRRKIQNLRLDACANDMITVEWKIQKNLEFDKIFFIKYFFKKNLLDIF